MKIQNETFSIKLQHNIRIYYRFDFTQNYTAIKRIMYYDFKDLIMKIYNKCERCSSGEVEDEYHFLFHSNKLENDRNLLLKPAKKLS